MKEVVIVSAVRTAIGNFSGSLSGFSAVDLGVIAAREAIARAGINPAEINEAIIGNILSAGLGQNPARQISIKAGIPDTSPAMVSINTCIMVDFTGQVASESIGTKQYSGTGGQTDTAVGAVEGFDGLGKSIIACRATARNGQISTIVPTLPEGTAVTLHRSHTDYVVTEWGSVRLTGLTVKERTKALISIAHPKFRDELTAQAEKLGYI